MKNKIYNYLLIIILIIGVFLGLYRFYPYFLGDIPLGYDPGLYRWMFFDYYNNLPQIDFSNLHLRTKQAYPPFLGILGNILLLIGVSVDGLLGVGLAFFSVITSIFIYLYLKKYSYQTAIFGVVIFLISIIQYESFLLNYYKQIIGIIFMLTSIYLLEKKKYILSIPVIISLFTIHRPAGLFFLVLFILYKLFNIIDTLKGKKIDIYIVFFSGLMAFLLYIPFLDYLILPLLNPLLGTYGISGGSGTFFEMDEFFNNNDLIIIASLYGLYYKIVQKKLDFTTLGYFLGIIWVGFGLFFYSRMLIFYDIFIIMTAAYGFGLLYKKNKKFLIVFILFFAMQAYNYVDYVSEYNEPYITEQEFEKIKQLDDLLPSDAILMTSHRTYSPWLYGYTNLPVIAPGLFEYDLWSVEQWSDWWKSDGVGKCKMIKDYEVYEKDIYLWLGINQYIEDLNGAGCFEVIFEEEENKLLRVKNIK